MGTVEMVVLFTFCLLSDKSSSLLSSPLSTEERGKHDIRRNWPINSFYLHVQHFFSISLFRRQKKPEIEIRTAWEHGDQESIAETVDR